jgi:hypothetical protein
MPNRARPHTTSFIAFVRSASTPPGEARATVIAAAADTAWVDAPLQPRLAALASGRLDRRPVPAWRRIKPDPARRSGIVAVVQLGRHCGR